MYKRYVISLLIMLWTVPVLAVPNERTRQEITILCEQLFADYAIYRDHLDAEAFASIFTEDAELILSGGTHKGHEALRNYINQHARPAYAHMVMITSTQITPQSETAATGLAYALVNGSDRHVGADDAPVEVTGVGAANQYNAEFVLTDDGWKIAKLQLQGVFSRPR